MRIEGRRVQIAGSASARTADELLRYGHELIAALTQALCSEGATFLLNVGKEPHSRPDDLSSPPIIFDWTAIEALGECLASGQAQGKTDYGALLTVLATSKTDKQIPDGRRPLWNQLHDADAIRLEYIEPGWAAGAVRRARQAELGDVLVVLSGGEGVEHLAQQYVAAGKPVLPFDLQLGSSSEDGSGGAAQLASTALAHPERFVRLTDSVMAATMLSRMSTRNGAAPIETVVRAVIDLLRALESPRAFYVRLLNPEVEEYSAVEQYFRNVVDPIVEHFGYTPVEMGRGPNTFAWMNEAIFDSLHYSSVVVVDLTGLRPNCFMELGYALGHAQRVIVTAMDGTRLPFDSQMIDCRMWSPSTPDDQRKVELSAYWERNIDRPPLVKLPEVP